MLQPSKEKFRKQFRGRNRGVATANNEVTFGEYGLKSMENAWLESREIEAARRAIVGYTKRKGRVWIKIFPSKSYTQKPNNSKMLGGKGDVQGHVAVVKPGHILYEITGVPKDVAQEALRLGGNKLSIKVKFVARKEF
jgi:large subunit ribosomal protein L16